jgi:predicted phage gp36 major capsid-like protein
VFGDFRRRLAADDRNVVRRLEDALTEVRQDETIETIGDQPDGG